MINWLKIFLLVCSIVVVFLLGGVLIGELTEQEPKIIKVGTLSLLILMCITTIVWYIRYGFI